MPIQILDLLHDSISRASAERENVERFTLSFAVFSTFGRMIPDESTNAYVLQMMNFSLVWSLPFLQSEACLSRQVLTLFVAIIASAIAGMCGFCKPVPRLVERDRFLFGLLGYRGEWLGWLNT